MQPAIGLLLSCYGHVSVEDVEHVKQRLGHYVLMTYYLSCALNTGLRSPLTHPLRNALAIALAIFVRAFLSAFALQTSRARRPRQPFRANFVVVELDVVHASQS